MLKYCLSIENFLEFNLDGISDLALGVFCTEWLVIDGFVTFRASEHKALGDGKLSLI